MIYEIETKSDLSGAMLVIRFPAEELDKKALYTIESDQPPFLVPFTYRSVDDMAECTYRLGSRSKLQYRFGTHSVQEYTTFWEQVLQPLLDCDDWFLKPFSFVLDSRWIYADKSGAVNYLYVPSLQDCESFDSLRAMAMELSQRNSVTDPALENQVLRAMMQDFQPKSFLSMLRSAAGTTGTVKKENPAPRVETIQQPAPQVQPAVAEPGFLPERLRPQEPSVPVQEPTPAQVAPMAPAADDGEIHWAVENGPSLPRKSLPRSTNRSLAAKRKSLSRSISRFSAGRKKSPVRSCWGPRQRHPHRRPIHRRLLHRPVPARGLP